MEQQQLTDKFQILSSKSRWLIVQCDIAREHEGLKNQSAIFALFLRFHSQVIFESFSKKYTRDNSGDKTKWGINSPTFNLSRSKVNVFSMDISYIN